MCLDNFPFFHALRSVLVNDLGQFRQWQLQGHIETKFNVSIYDIDLFNAPNSTIEKLHNEGNYLKLEKLLSSS